MLFDVDDTLVDFGGAARLALADVVQAHLAGDDDDALPPAVVPTGLHGLAHLLFPVLRRRLLRDHQPVGRRSQRRHECEVAAVPAHHLDDERSLVAGCGAAQGIQCFDDAVQCRVGADRHVGPGHVVIDRTDEPDQPQERVCVRGLLG